MKTVIEDVLSLSVAERLQLVEDIWDSIAATPEAVPVTDARHFTRSGAARGSLGTR